MAVQEVVGRYAGQMVSAILLRAAGMELVDEAMGLETAAEAGEARCWVQDLEPVERTQLVDGVGSTTARMMLGFGG